MKITRIPWNGVEIQEAARDEWIRDQVKADKEGTSFITSGDTLIIRSVTRSDSGFEYMIHHECKILNSIKVER